MTRKPNTGFKTYAAVQQFAAGLMKCGSSRAANELMNRLLAGKEVTPSIVSAVLISAHAHKNPNSAFHFMQFCRQVYDFTYSAEHYSLAVRCGLDPKTLGDHFFPDVPAELRRSGRLPADGVRSNHAEAPQVATKLTGQASAGSAELPYCSRTYKEMMELPIVRYYAAQKVLTDAKDVSQFTTKLSASLSRDVSFATSRNIYRDDMSLFAKVNPLLQFAPAIREKYLRCDAVRTSKARVDIGGKDAPLIVARTPTAKNYMKQLHDKGLVSIQSVGSSLAVEFMQIEPGMHVLDMCAAPGNKTLSILEKVGRSSGLVIANDQSADRVKSLHRRFAPFGASNLLITKYPAERFPSRVSMLRNATSDMEPQSSQVETRTTAKLSFDRVLVDISCSGDGRILKDPHILPRWNPFDGVLNFPHQKQALLRALQLVKPGGLVLYVTCSLNPLENEAVISALLRSYPDEIRVTRLHREGTPTGYTTKLRPGLTTWGVPQSSEAHQFRPASSQAGQDGNSHRSIFHETPACLARVGDVVCTGSALMAVDQHNEMFPLHLTQPGSVGEWITKSLTECRRLVPTDDDDSSTGFFFALLKKVKELPPTPTEVCMETHSGRNRMLEVLTALGIGKSFFNEHVLAFHGSFQQVSYVLSKSLSRSLGTSGLRNQERLRFPSGQAGSIRPLCTLSIDDGRSLTHQGVQLVGSFASPGRRITIEEKAFLLLV
ncbi:S-adenosyl-L-methionine-dependent methyltransferase, partial [Perkinsela sp. CCAP 1560/4]